LARIRREQPGQGQAQPVPYYDAAGEAPCIGYGLAPALILSRIMIMRRIGYGLDLPLPWFLALFDRGISPLWKIARTGLAPVLVPRPVCLRWFALI